MKYYFFVFALFWVTLTTAQTKSFKIHGTLIAETDKTALESATIYLERIKDSSLVSYTISDKNGEFYLEGNTTENRLNLYISYVGYQTHYQSIGLDQETINLNAITLKTDVNALDAILIKSTAPIMVKKDTLTFNVKSFKTKKDANVEDLLKQLPGLEVDAEGEITIDGKPVDNILVNGKPFFGDDPTIATRNLSKDILKNVQITDTKTRDEAFAGDEGSKDKKTINLTMKEENNNGVFGRIAAGTGTNKRYELAGMLNLFDNDQRISILARKNNINAPGFSFGSRTGTGEGITTSQNYGANYVDNLTEKVDISANYFFSGSDSENKSTTQSEYFLPSSSYFNNSETNSSNESDNHRVNLGFNIAVDSTLLINIGSSFNTTNNKTETSEEDTSSDAENILTNQSSSSLFVETIDKNFNNHLAITKRFGKNGAYFKFNISNKYETTETDDYLYSETTIFGNDPEVINRNQFTNGHLKLQGIYTSTAVRWPLKAKELFLDFKFSYSHDKQENIMSTYAFDASTQDFTLFDIDLSTDFEYINKSRSPALKLTYKKEKWSIGLESGYIFRTLQNIDFLRPDLSLTHDFEAVELRSNFMYQFSPKSYIYSGYNLNNTPPLLSQLQPFQDVSDPLNTITGNPNLEPTNTHSFYFGHNTFNFQKRTGFFSRIHANFKNNEVVAKTTIDENFIQNTTYTNVNGGYNISASGNYSKTIKIDTLKTVKYNVALSTSINRSVNFNNEVQYISNNTALTPYAGITFEWNDVMMITPSYRLSFNKTKFDLDSFEDQEFIDHSVGLQLATFIPKKFEWQNDISFNYNPNMAEGFQKSAWFWNTTLVHTIHKDQGTLALKVYDLLNQNTNAKRIATENYIQDSQSTVLTQYVMLSLSWKLNNFKTKTNNYEGNP